jgi:4-hydroxybutyrate CoA-transferase
MDWKKIYAQRKVSAAEAVTHIKSNDYVVVGHAAGEPGVLLDAMVANKDQYRNVTLMHMIAMGTSPYCAPGLEENFVHNSFFCGKSSRDAVNAGRAVFTPMFQHEIPKLFTTGMVEVDAALIQVSKPDKHGYCSHGISVDYTKDASEAAKLVIAEVNDQMPRTLGDCFIHVSDIDYIVETSHSPVIVPPSVIDELDKKIGDLCASLIDDGSTIQLGIGSMPDAVAYALRDKKDLGVHTELISEALVDLIVAGVINGRRKTIHRCKIIATLLMGTKKLYDFVDDNPILEMHSTAYTNDPRVIAQNYRMTSVNSCIQIDLMGQSASETIGYRQFSGTGGQSDFMRGAAMADGGKSILVMKSTAKNNTVSKITPILDEGSAVTNLRNDVHYVVTEYGIADLKGKSLPQRARALINIAHPNFRDELREVYAQRFRHRF